MDVQLQIKRDVEETHEVSREVAEWTKEMAKKDAVLRAKEQKESEIIAHVGKNSSVPPIRNAAKSKEKEKEKEKVVVNNHSNNEKTANEKNEKKTEETKEEDIGTKKKNAGNDLFQQGRYDEALAMYAQALHYGENAVLYANRAMCLIKLERWESALEEASSAVKLQPTYVKAHQRKAVACLKLGKTKEAFEAYDLALSLDPKNKALIDEVNKARETNAATTTTTTTTATINANSAVKKNTSSSTGATTQPKKTEKKVTINETPVVTAKTSPPTSPPTSTTTSPPPAKTTETVEKKKEPQKEKPAAVTQSQSQRRRLQIVESDGSDDEEDKDKDSKKKESPKQSEATVKETPKVSPVTKTDDNNNNNDNSNSSSSNSKVTIQTGKGKNITTKTIPIIAAPVPENPPETASEFERVWTGLAKTNKDGLTIYLQKLIPNVIHRIFTKGVELDSQIFASMLNVMVKDEYPLLLACHQLDELTKIDRFSILVMFLEPSDRGNIHQIMSRALNNQTLPEGQIVNIKNHYKIK